MRDWEELYKNLEEEHTKLEKKYEELVDKKEAAIAKIMKCLEQLEEEVLELWQE